jgi:hypothetical protein
MNGGVARRKKAISHHQECDHRQKKDGVGVNPAGFAVPGRHSVTSRLEGNSADDRNRHAEEDDGCGVVCNEVVCMTNLSREAWDSEVVGESENKQGESPSRQDNEARKDKDMKGSCGPITRMLPLPQPELEHPSQSEQWPIKAKIPFAPNERRDALREDIGKTSDAQKMND